MKLGELLKAAREEKQVTLREAEKVTKIRTSYLEALEEENFHLLPGRIYVIGFLKSYAKYLGLSSVEVTELYKTQHPDDIEEEPSKSPAMEEVPISSGPSKKLYYLVVVLALGLLFAVGIWYQGSQNDDFQKNDPREDNLIGKENLDPIEDETVEDEREAEVENEPSVISKPLNLKIEIVSEPCWVKVVVDEKVVLSEELKPNTVKEFSGYNEIQVRFGNAGAAKVSFNGEDLGIIGEKGKVIDKKFNLP